MRKIYCTECGKSIEKPYYIDGKPYGYTCYKREMAIRLAKIKLAEQEEKNARYSCECFCAMEIFKNKKPGRFHDSICEQWNACHKLTINQLKAIINSFSTSEKVVFYALQANLQKDKYYKMSASGWMETEIHKLSIREQKALSDNDIINQALLENRNYKKGFVWVYDFDIDMVMVEKISTYEKCDKEDPYIELLKMVTPTPE